MSIFATGNVGLGFFISLSAFPQGLIMDGNDPLRGVPTFVKTAPPHARTRASKRGVAPVRPMDHLNDLL